MPNQKMQGQLDLNLDQWRQDIKTFVAATKNELHEITDQLSSTMAGDAPSGPSTQKPSLQTLSTETPSVSTSVPSARPTVSEGVGKADDRISRLKQQLAARTKK